MKPALHPLSLCVLCLLCACSSEKPPDSGTDAGAEGNDDAGGQQRQGPSVHFEPSPGWLSIGRAVAIVADGPASDILYRFDNGNDFGAVFNPYKEPFVVFTPGLPPLEAKVVAFAGNEAGLGPVATGTFKRWPEQFTLRHSLVVGELSDVSATRDIPTDDHLVATCSGLPPGLAASGTRIQGSSSAIGVTEAKCTNGDSRGNSVTTSELFVVGKTVSDVTMDGLQKCAIATDGEARCWDFSESGEAVVPSGLKLKSIATGSEMTCGIGLDDA